MKTLFLSLALALFPLCSHALDVFNLNVFDQLQGEWEPGFREQRMSLVGDYLRKHAPAIVVFQEARGNLPGAYGGGNDTSDAKGIASIYPYRKYVHEMTGKDGASYGYWIGAKKAPRVWIEDGFSFEGGVSRKIIGGIWDHAVGKKCLGVVGLHLSYQNSRVRQKEAYWLLEWIKAHESACGRWLVVGDFNADAPSPEMQILFAGGLRPLYREFKPTIGAFNPIRRIYGNNIPSLTIDWALAWNVEGAAQVVLDAPYSRGRSGRESLYDGWVSDHAAIDIQITK